MEKKIRLPVLDERLMLIASLVREGAVPADIGTDHAYIPIYLIQSGICRYAVASDINSKPLNIARANAEKFGVYDKIRFYLSDGLSGINPVKNGVTDVLICGMGGELIAKIIGDSEFVRTPGVRLILQPMSSVYELRGYLAVFGFNVKCEKLCRSGDKIYTCIVCEYDGIKREIPDIQLELGYSINAEESDEYLNMFLEKTAVKLKNQIEGKTKGGCDTSREQAILSEVREIAKARGYHID